MQASRICLALLGPLTGFTVALALMLLLRDASGGPFALADGPALAIDANPTGNTATHIETVNACVSLRQGVTFQVDIVIQDVVDLLAWEAYVGYDARILRVVDRDVRFFQAANAGSSVYDLSERVPSDTGAYRLTVADTSDPPTPDSGSGVLARLTFQAVANGSTAVALTKEDLTGDGTPDRGPFLRDASGAAIGDSDGDTFFDGETAAARATVGAPCPGGSNSGGQTTGEASDGGFPALYIVAAGLSVAAVGAFAGLLLLLIHRARASRESRDGMS